MSKFKEELVESEEELFGKIKGGFLDYDPAYYVENNLTIDGQPFKIVGNGWKFMADIYRYIALQATTESGKPVVLCKGRQIGATMMAGALDLYLTNSGLFSNPPIRVLHAFPTLAMVKKFTQDKLEGMVRSAKDDLINKNKLKAVNAVDNLTMKQFNTGTLWVDSLGRDGDRIRGMTCDVAFFDECFPYNQNIETSDGKVEIGKLYDLYKTGKPIPDVISFNEISKKFEFKKVLNAWNRGKKDLVKIYCKKRTIKCTPNHKFLTADGWKAAEDLMSDDLLISKSCERKIDSPSESIIVQRVEILDEKEVVYDIEVEDNHNFIVTSSDDTHGGPIAHNCQDMYGLSIGNTTKTLTQAKYGPIGKGVQVYFGTPKQRSSYFHSIWEMSDKRYYHLGCSNCEKTFPFYTTGSEKWKDIWTDGFTIQCPLCGHKQHKIESIERGEWIPSVDPSTAKYVGFHINQLYLPNFPKQNILDLMPENNPTQSVRVWNNEVIGEFYSGSGLPLSKADIYENCRDPERYFASKIDPAKKRTYLGADWGGKVDNDSIDRGQSYSCIVVLSAQADGTLLVEHAHKIGEHGFKHKIATVKECYRRFGIQRGVSDWFYGNDVVEDLQGIYRERFLGAQGSGNLRNAIKFREDELMLSYNKDLVIDEIFDKFRKGKIRFPWKSYEHLEWLIDHCTSMEMGTRTSSGQQIKVYKKGSIPNDGLMALMYAYMAWKFDVTKGYSVKPGAKAERRIPLPVLAHIPRLR